MTTFISYSRINSDFTVRLARDLKAADYDIWFDQIDILTGSRWDDEIEKALESSDTFLIILSPQSIQSQNVKDEIGYAIDAGKNILPVVLENCKVPFRLRRFQYVDFTGKPYDESLTKIKYLLDESRKAENANERVDEKFRPSPDSSIAQKKNTLESKPGYVQETQGGKYGSKWAPRTPITIISIAMVFFAALFGVIFAAKELTGIDDVSPGSSDSTALVPMLADVIYSKGVPMVLVPAGAFTMGAPLEQAEQAFADCQKETNDQCQREWFTNETPQHKVTLNDYYIDQYEMTNARYAECVEEGVCNAPSPTSSFMHDGYYGIAEFDNYPVIYVTWFDGNAYCRWRGARLPTEAEWEKAARGMDGFLYPWGNDFDGTKLNFCDTNCPLDWANKDYDDGYADTSPVGSYEGGKSPYGAYDMAGNVWEWVNDWYDEEYYSISPSFNPLGPDAGQYPVLRGGSWSNVYSGLHSSLRSWDVVPSLAQYGYYGFRCARGANP